MTKILLKLFVKNWQDPEDPTVHSAIGTLAGTTGILCNCLLFLGKLLTGLLVGSVSIVADALNNLSDAASSVVTLLGFRLARRPADAHHPYGHARYEYLSGLAVAALILLIGGSLARSSVEKILRPEPVEASAAVFVVLACSIGVKLWMSGFFGDLGKRIHSTTLQATSVDSRNDVVATSGVLLGCLAERLFGVHVDGYVGLAVALFILWSGFQIGRETVSPLLGQQADEKLVEKLSALVLEHDKVLGIHDLLVHDYGPGQCFASVHAELSAGEDPFACHDIIDGIEREALERLNVHLVIHYDPVAEGDREWNEMRQIVEGIIRTLDPRLSMHDFRLVRGGEPAKLVFDLAVPYSMEKQSQQIQEGINAALRQAGKSYETEIRFEGKA